jgi:hypothetical protein
MLLHHVEFDSVVSSVSCFSTISFARVSSSNSSCAVTILTSSSCSLGWYAPPYVSNLGSWMCCLFTITLLSMDSSYSHKSEKSMLSASSSSGVSSSTVISYSTQWLRLLSHSSKCSSPSICRNVSWKPSYGSRLFNQSSNISNSISH